MAYSGHVCPLGREEGGEAHHGGEGYIRNCHSIDEGFIFNMHLYFEDICQYICH